MGEPPAPILDMDWRHRVPSINNDRVCWFGYNVGMTTTRIIQEALALSAAERMDVIDRLWASIAAEPKRLELTDAQREELDRRIVEMDANPDARVRWEDVKKSLMS